MKFTTAATMSPGSLSRFQCPSLNSTFDSVRWLSFIRPNPNPNFRQNCSLPTVSTSVRHLVDRRSPYSHHASIQSSATISELFDRSFSKTCINSSRHWTPPEEGSLVVDCAARTGRVTAGISAIARDCNGDVVAVAIERKICKDKIEAQLQSIYTALKLAKKLTEEQKFDAITIRTHHKRALQLIDSGIYVGEGDDDDDDVSDDDDTDGGDEYSVTLMGDAVAEGIPQSVKDLIEKDKVLAGLPITKKAAKSTAEAKEAAKSSSSKEAKDAVESAASEATSNALTVEGLPITKKAAKSTAEAKEAAKSSSSKEAMDAVESAASEATSIALTVEGTSATKEAAGSVNLGVANQDPNAGGSDSTALWRR